MFHPIRASENIKEEFISYIKTTYPFADQELQRQLVEELESFIAKGPYLEIGSAFVQGKSLRKLIEEGVLSPLFEELEKGKHGEGVVLPLDRKLYYHQEKAIRSITSGRNAIISTGTGSGKTNCFLVPVLNELLREKERGTLGPGIRALFIYPMNALSNDQMKNIRRILRDYEDITFGSYNGGTEEEEEDAKRLYQAMFENERDEKLRTPLKNELLSREEMKETPPNILFTNYAMLEHLLLRPNDDVLFSHADFRFVVLDEAHVYSGATGIETAILLRRLQARISSSSKTQFILTSATLGKGESYDADILKFGNNLCGVPFYQEDIIRSQRVPYFKAEKENILPLPLIRLLADETKSRKEVLDQFSVSYEKGSKTEEILYTLISESSLYHRLRECYLRSPDGIESLESLKKDLNLSEEDLIAFLSLCFQAKKGGSRLIDARYHYFLRCLEGVFLTFGKEKKLFLTRKQTWKDEAVFEIALCPDCGHYAFVGNIQNGKLVQSSKSYQDVDYFYLSSEEEEDEEGEIPEEYYLCPHCGAIIEKENIENIDCDCENKDYLLVRKVHKTEKGKASCGNCHQSYYSRMLLGSNAATSVLATALYEELPEAKYVEKEDEAVSSNPFLQAIRKNGKEKVRASRQFLIFSDSRQEAAKFACYLSKSYEEFLRRRAICHVIEKNRETILKGDYTVSDLVENLTSYFSTNRTFASSMDDQSNQSAISRKNAWVAVLNEMVHSTNATSLTSLGILSFDFLGNVEDIIQSVADQHHVPFDRMKNLLGLLIQELIKMNVLVPDDLSDISDDDREYIYYSSVQNYVTEEKGNDRKSYHHAWMPKAREKGGYYLSNRLHYVMDFLSCDEADAYKFLKDYFLYLTGKPWLTKINHDQIYVLPASHFVIRIPGDGKAKWYRCKKCGKISLYHRDGHCILSNCNGKVEEIDPKRLSKDNHFANLYFSDKMSPLYVKEHTAQLSRKESADYQEQFIKKQINALSCSTTFEMGVDVGDLEAVFLRDVPPLPSNYAQRAGRAGRSEEAAAYCLTYAKLSSHDLTYFSNPLEMIDGMILPPLFKLDNEKIVRRHIYDIAFGMFFREYPDQYDRNQTTAFLKNKGYLEFEEWLRKKPERLEKLLVRSIPDINHLHQRLGILDYSWIDGLIGPQGILTLLIEEYENNIRQFNTLINKEKKNQNFSAAASLQSKLRQYENNKLIDFLARGNILPRYGFPVDTVELEQNTSVGEESQLCLARDMSQAIAEYAPSSEVVANGKLYTSRYIKKAKTAIDDEGFSIAYIGTCPNDECGASVYSKTPIPEEGIPCPSCGEILHEMDFEESIEPVSGFIAEKEVKEVPFTSQERNYRSEETYIGNKSDHLIEEKSFRFNNRLVRLQSRFNDPLLVQSLHDFYVCKKCGYAISALDPIAKDEKADKARKNLSKRIELKTSHQGPYGNYTCSCNTLHRYRLHHVFLTDVTRITFGEECSDFSTMLSVMYALLYTATDYLTIERKDLKACLDLEVNQGHLQYSIVFYDSVPGGAGHSRRLFTDDGMLLQTIIRKAKQRMDCCHCEPSCYNCLRSYENQKHHDELDRQKASEFLSQFIGDVRVESEEEEEETF